MATKWRIFSVVILVVIAGCSGATTMGTEEATTEKTTPYEQISCTNGKLPEDLSIESILPPAPEGWTKSTELTRLSKEAEDGSTTREMVALNYTTPDGVVLPLWVTQWESEAKTKKQMNDSAFGAQAVSGVYSFLIMTNSSNFEEASHLLASIPCVGSDDVRTEEFRAKINNVEYEVVPGYIPEIKVTIIGEFENANVEVRVGDQFPRTIREDELKDGQAKTEVRVMDDVEGDTVTLNVTAYGGTALMGDKTVLDSVEIEVPLNES